MNDTIYRQAAIEALQEHRNLFCDNTPETFSKLSYAEKSRVDELDTAIATLINLPSAQPEVIYCKDCKYFERDIQRSWGTYNGCGVWTDDGNETEVKLDDFCSYAERREE